MNSHTSILRYILFLQIFTLSVQGGSIQGDVKDTNGSILSGVNIFIQDEGIGTTSNRFGKYSLENLARGSYELVISYVGYKQLRLVLDLDEGQILYQNIVLKEDILKMGSILVTAQKKVEQIQDVPISMSILDDKFLELNSHVNLDALSGYVPGLNINVNSNNRPNFVIRGLTSDAFLAGSQPRVSVFYNNIPISRTSGALVELYDMERIEVLNGPQGTLFGRGAQIGSVHLISNKPNQSFLGKVSMGFGNHGQKFYTGMINLPLTNNFFMRLAATTAKREGFVKNTFGGGLNERNTDAVRSSLRYIPTDRTILDLMIEYQDDNPGGTAFLSRIYPNKLGEINVFSNTASLERGSELGLKRKILNLTFNVHHSFDNNIDLNTFISYREHSADEIWDGDGSAAPALNFSEYLDTDQISLESRLNFKTGHRFSGFAGISYWKENVKQRVHFSPNEQSLFFLFFNPQGLVDNMGNPNFIPALPPIEELGPLGGIPLPIHHIEESYQNAGNSALEVFADGTFRLTNKLQISAGLRLVSDRLSLEAENKMIDGDPSTLGHITGNYPNVLLTPGKIPGMTHNFKSLVGRLVAKYAFSGGFKSYIGFSRCRRPNVIQVRADAQAEILDDEKVNSFDIGIKGHLSNRFFIDLASFFHDYTDFQTRTWIADQQTGEFQLIVKDGGEAYAYGFESNIRYAYNKYLQFFVSYAFIHARFNNTDRNGNRQDYAGNRFRLTPDHSGSFRANLLFPLFNSITFYFSPSFIYKSHHFFEDNNARGLEQSDFGLFHLQSGVYLDFLQLEISVFGYNLLNKHFLVSAGNTGNLFGIPTFVPGTQRTVGLKFKLDF
jgi:outer membrane receptor protein involved in Fe transport